MHLCDVVGPAAGSAHGMPSSGLDLVPAGDYADGVPHSRQRNAACSADGTHGRARDAVACMAWADMVDDAEDSDDDAPALVDAKQN